MLKIAVAFTNFGPYHLARLRALGAYLERVGGELIAYELAGSQALYPWSRTRQSEPFRWVTLFLDSVMETLSAAECQSAMTKALGRDRPNAVGVVGYFRPESLAMLRWARSNRRPSVLMSETQEIDHPRVWWREAIKRRRVTRFSAGLVGGPRHRDYLEKLGMPAERVALGYNAIDHLDFAARADADRRNASTKEGLPAAPYFLAISRFASEKNLPRLIQAYRRYRSETTVETPWDLVLCGDGPNAPAVHDAIAQSGLGASIHTPGFLQASSLSRWLAHASAFVHPAVSEPWGLVVNEAASTGLPLLISDRAGAVETFVPIEGPTSGRRLDPFDVESMAAALHWMSDLPAGEREALGQCAFSIAEQWGPDRFVQGAIEAFQLAFAHQSLTSESLQFQIS